MAGVPEWKRIDCHVVISREKKKKNPTESKNEFMNLSAMRNDCRLLDTINPSH